MENLMFESINKRDLGVFAGGVATGIGLTLASQAAYRRFGKKDESKKDESKNEVKSNGSPSARQ